MVLKNWNAALCPPYQTDLFYRFITIAVFAYTLHYQLYFTDIQRLIQCRHPHSLYTLPSAPHAHANIHIYIAN